MTKLQARLEQALRERDEAKAWAERIGAWHPHSTAGVMRLIASEADNAALVEALHKSCGACNGTRKRWTECSYCGDSTYDHVCDDGEVACTNPVHMLADQPHPGAALLREVLALRAVVDELRPHAERWKKLGPTLTNGWLEPHEVRALIAACAEADKARTP